MNQIETVKNRVLETGSVDNLWAINNNILRLGAIIHKLKRRDNMCFTGKFGKELGMERRYWKNFYYTLDYGFGEPKNNEPVVSAIIKPLDVVESKELTQAELPF